MEKTYEIKELEQVLKPHLGPNESVMSYEAKPLTAAGENFGSLMLAVNVTTKDNKTRQQKCFNSVAKMCPPNQLLKDIFNVQVSVKKEISMYTTIINELQNFAKEYKFPEPLDFLADYYGSRISLNPKSTTVDDDSILILANLKDLGFSVGDRFVGFDVETVKVILRDLVPLHAIPLAYKLLRFKEFESIFMPHLGNTFNEALSPEFKEDVLIKRNQDLIRNASQGDLKCAEFIPRLLKILDSSGPPNAFKAPPLSHPYGTICHFDLWVNNVMVKYVNGKPVKAKLVDFQMYTYESLAKDLVFLLFSSVQPSILRQHLDEFITFYHSRFIDILQAFGCKTDIYTLESLYEEIRKALRESEIGHIIFMFTPILAEKGAVKNLEEVDPMEMMNREPSEIYKKRLADTILLLAERQWL